MRATDLAHLVMRQSIKAGDWVIDATVGNGHDTLFLAEIVGPTGRVFGFDVQLEALERTAERLAHLPQVTLVHDGHENLSGHLLPDTSDQLSGVMFNLGYLPGASRETITRAESTLGGLDQALAHLGVPGVVTVVMYPGHDGGEEETVAVRAFAEGLGPSFTVMRHSRLNSARPAPELLTIHRIN